MSNAARWAQYGAKGGGDYANVDPDKITIAEEDPAHPEHAAHVERTRLDKPIMQALMQSMRAHGTSEVRPILVYLDGDALTVADGRRSTVACREVNAERRKERKPILRLRAVRTKDPVLARNLSNSCREDDPPMVVARRFREASEIMDPNAAAACLGLTLAHANALLRCLSLPADIQARVNAREIPPDVAARLGKAGSEKAREIVSGATGEDGKVNERKARKAARQETKRARGRSAKVARSIAAECARMGEIKEGEYAPDRDRYKTAAAVIEWFCGGNAPAWLARVVESAEAARKGKRAGDGGEHG